MKIFVRYILSYFESDFKWAPHLLSFLFLAVAIFLNYYFDWYDSIQAQHKHSFIYVIILFGFYATAFLAACFSIALFSKESNPLRNKKFLVFAGVGIFFLALDNSYYLIEFVKPFFSENIFLQNWQKSIVSNLSSFIAVILPLYILYYCVHYFKPEFYGFRLNGARISNYFWLILCMIPLIILASFRPDFLETYPTYNDNFEYRFLGTEQWVTVGIYELTYGFDFISVELFFRGFMVVALSRFVGKNAILPMVVVYAFLHFGKPAGETISSIFGGYILGILAFQSRNIFGGLVAHLGVAWGMEYFAWLRL